MFVAIVYRPVKVGFQCSPCILPRKDTPLTDITQSNILRYKTIEDGSITEDFWIIQVHILPIEIPFGS